MKFRIFWNRLKFYIENLQQQINAAIDVKSNLVYQKAQLQDKENNLKKILKVVLAGFNIFIKIKEESKWKSQRWKKHLNNSRNYDIYTLEAYQKLEETLIDNI